MESDGFSISFRSLQAWFAAYNAPGPNGRKRGVEALIDRRAVANRDGDEIDEVRSGRDREAKRKGWAWPASYSATRKWLRTYDDKALSFLLRYGNDAWCRRFMPYITIDPTLIQPAQLYQTDHHQVDF